MAEQQTRGVQGAVGAILWRCKSSCPHRENSNLQFSIYNEFSNDLIFNDERRRCLKIG